MIIECLLNFFRSELAFDELRTVSRCTSVLYRINCSTLCPRKNGPPKHDLKFSKLASFAQFQFNSMNICLFSIKVPILVKICPTVIEILTFSK